jgi:putative transposase
MMRYTQTEKMEIIRTVEGSELSVRDTLQELDVPKTSFYEWYARYERSGYDGLASRKPETKQFWNRIPDHEREQVVSLALAEPEKTPRELAWTITD